MLAHEERATAVRLWLRGDNKKSYDFLQLNDKNWFAIQNLQFGVALFRFVFGVFFFRVFIKKNV